MPAKIRTIKARSASTSEHFYFNRSIQFKGGLLGQIKFFPKKSGIIKIKLYQDLDKNNKISKDDLIFKGKVADAKHSDELINFVGTIKFKKQMHSCDWEKQKQPGEFIACTRDYVPTLHELMLKPDLSGEKIYAEGLGEFRNEQLFDTYLL